MSLEMKVVDLGHMTYADAWEQQQALLGQRMRGEIPDTLVLVEHPPTITFGSSQKWNTHLGSRDEFDAKLRDRGIALHESTSRGGGAAYLGPGQLVGYVHMDVTAHGGILPFMRMLEEVMIRTGRAFDIPIERRDTENPTTDKPYRATWYNNQGTYSVLCTKGIGTRRDTATGKLYSHHGFSLSVHQNNSYLDLIHPCGFPVHEVPPISMQDVLGYAPDMQRVKDAVVDSFTQVRREVIACQT